jgi:hypothetical protein
MALDGGDWPPPSGLYISVQIIPRYLSQARWAPEPDLDTEVKSLPLSQDSLRGARVQSKAGPYEIYSGQSVAEIGFSATASFQRIHGSEVSSIYHRRYVICHLRALLNEHFFECANSRNPVLLSSTSLINPCTG